MPFEDYLEPEVAIAAAVTAAIVSPSARRLLRRAAVLGLSGILIAGDALTSFGRGIGQGAHEMSPSSAEASPETSAPPAAGTQPRRSRRAREDTTPAEPRASEGESLS